MSFNPSSGALPLPIYIRLPKSGTRCHYTGLSRSALNSLILPSKENGFRPPVKSISDKKKGAVRGVRLILLESLLAYLEALSVEEVAS